MHTRPRPDVTAAYVTSDGLVRLPPRILRALGLEPGKGVNFLFNKQSGHVELLSDPQVDALFDQQAEATDTAPTADGDDSL
jgi:antitoxin component of MazEF toxin-antitoxin module